jgi:hypothetical protein
MGMEREDDDEIGARDTEIPGVAVAKSGDSKNSPNDIRQFVQAVRERVGEAEWAKLDPSVRAFAEAHAKQGDCAAMRSTVQYVLNASIDLDLPADLHAEVIRNSLLLYSWVIRKEMLDSMEIDFKNGCKRGPKYTGEVSKLIDANIRSAGETMLKYMEVMTNIPVSARNTHGGLN